VTSPFVTHRPLLHPRFPSSHVARLSIRRQDGGAACHWTAHSVPTSGALRELPNPNPLPGAALRNQAEATGAADKSRPGLASQATAGIDRRLRPFLNAWSSKATAGGKSTTGCRVTEEHVGQAQRTARQAYSVGRPVEDRPQSSPCPHLRSRVGTSRVLPIVATAE